MDDGASCLGATSGADAVPVAAPFGGPQPEPDSHATTTDARANAASSARTRAAPGQLAGFAFFESNGDEARHGDDGEESDDDPCIGDGALNFHACEVTRGAIVNVT